MDRACPSTTDRLVHYIIYFYRIIESKSKFKKYVLFILNINLYTFCVASNILILIILLNMQKSQINPLLDDGGNPLDNDMSVSNKVPLMINESRVPPESEESADDQPP